MPTIPASLYTNVTPSVLSAGGAALITQGMILTPQTRVPIGSVFQFANQPAVAAFFGPNSPEAQIATIYFLGPNGATQLPGSILFTQYNPVGVPAYLRSGIVSGLTLAQLQALTGVLTITVDGIARTSNTINLSSAVSFTSAAALIQAGLNNSLPVQATVTGSIAASTATFTGSINGNVMTVSAMTSGTIVNGAVVTGTGVTTCTISGQLTGTTGGVGTYAVSVAQTVVSGTALTAAYGTLTVSAVTSGTLGIGQSLSGSGITVGTQITQLGTGTGGTGTYFVNPSQTAASTTVTASATAVLVSYDSQLGEFVVTSGVLIGGTTSTIGFATGTLSVGLSFTLATGAVTSQGAAPAQPAAFMNGVIAITTNWVTFMLVVDPDLGLTGGPQKLLFAQWNNGQNNRYMFVCWDTDVSPTTQMPATSSLGWLITQINNYAGTCLVWGTDFTKAALICSWAASLNFNATNGRDTLAYTSQTGLVAEVTSSTVAINLGGNPNSGSFGNGYNHYDAVGTANQNFLYMQRGIVSGPFQWADSYVNQIWMNSQFQLAMQVLVTTIGTIPFNFVGAALVEGALASPISAALNFAAINTNVALSSSQVQSVNQQAGVPIDAVLSTRGWYLQVGTATPQVRAARSSPPCTFWYTDGGSIQQLNLASVEVQ